MIENNNDIESILSLIRSGKSGRDEVIEELYYNKELNNKIRALILSHNGNESDFESIFNITLMQFVKTVVKRDDFRIKSSIFNYLIGIAKFQWFTEVRKRKKQRYESIDHFDFGDEQTPEKLIIDFDQKKMIELLLLKLKKNCKDILLYWANGYKMKEIARLLSYKSEGMAKKKKYYCLKELIIYLDKNPEIKSILR